MARLNLIICDRCGEEIAMPTDVRTVTDGWVRSGDRDLCADCYAAFKLFINGEDQVGKYVFKLVPAPCPHHVPCASPCASEYKLVARG